MLELNLNHASKRAPDNLEHFPNSIHVVSFE